MDASAIACDFLRYISAVHLTEKGCPDLPDDGLSNFETNQSRAQVNFDASGRDSNHPSPRHTDA